jgi:hypothetical protein
MFMLRVVQDTIDRLCGENAELFLVKFVVYGNH